MDAPSIAELLQLPGVVLAIEDAWKDSLAGDPYRRHEEGGWIYSDVTTPTISIRRAARGERAGLELGDPPMVLGSVVVATFHTHPNPSSAGYRPGPSDEDIRTADIAGVPCVIRADDGYHTTGPARRRGGLTGLPGFPA